MDHSGSDAFCAIVGGYVVRDPGLPTLNGRYLYGDNCQPPLYSAAPRTGAGNRPDGADRRGALVVRRGRLRTHLRRLAGSAPVYRIQDGAPSPCTTTIAGRRADRLRATRRA